MGKPLLRVLALALAGCGGSGFGKDDARELLARVEATVARASTSNATAIRGKRVSATAPTSGQVLTYDGTEYAPATPVAGGAGVEVLSSQVNIANSGVTGSPTTVLHSVSVPAQATDGTFLELEAICQGNTPSDGFAWDARLGGVSLTTVVSNGTITVDFSYEVYRVRITRTGATTAQLTFYKRNIAGVLSETRASITGLDWTGAQTLETRGDHSSDGTKWREFLFTVKLGTP